jgi:hypothetical protein
MEIEGRDEEVGDGEDSEPSDEENERMGEITPTKA